MTRPFTIAAAQYPLDWLADFAAYETKLRRWVAEGADGGADLLAFPEYAGLELAYAGPDTDDACVPIPHRRLFAVLKDAPNMENAKLFQNFIMAPENAALISDFARYNNGIMGSDKYMDQNFAQAPEIKAPAGSPTPEFVPPCSKEVTEVYNKIWTSLLKERPAASAETL